MRFLLKFEDANEVSCPCVRFSVTSVPFLLIRGAKPCALARVEWLFLSWDEAGDCGEFCRDIVAMTSFGNKIQQHSATLHANPALFSPTPPHLRVCFCQILWDIPSKDGGIMTIMRNQQNQTKRLLTVPCSLSLHVPECACMCLHVPACPCMCLHVPACACIGRCLSHLLFFSPSIQTICQ